jgi:hypothetical protein
VNEPVLLIPMVLSLLGDNPMQSEFACHIGLKGKLFCRACWVKGTDAQADATQHQSDSPKASSHGSEADTVGILILFHSHCHYLMPPYFFFHSFST